MKPRIFIGSSVEGLSIAYAIQQNLTHNAEVTVWDQGVFELSQTTIESLVKILENSDFGVFVFSNDDIIKIRNEEKNSVRDNVLFEFGLFIGKLSRKRVFFVIPSDTELHLPTDLLGITPGKFDPNREDGSLQAATGPVSNQIREATKKLGRITSDDDSPIESKKEDNLSAEDSKWIGQFLDGNYEEAKETLEKIKSTGDKKIENEIWKAYCDFKLNEKEGLKTLDKILKNNDDNVIAVRGIARIFLWEDYLDKSASLIETNLKKFKNDSTLITLLSSVYVKTKGLDEAIEFIKKYNPEENIDIAIEAADLLMEEDRNEEARNILHTTYQNFPKNEVLRYKYARVALELEENEVAFFLLDSLTKEFSDNASYWGYLSNCSLQLDYYDISLSAARKAEEITKSKEEWILSNIGNMLKNRGFYSEGIKYLEKSIELNKGSEYAHDRLATSLKLKEEERKKASETFKVGRRKIREFGNETTHNNV
ncbi:DNA-binding protein [bacterium]|nr:DNA-binding protein [bacterium]